MESQPQNAEFRINPENFHPFTVKIFIQSLACKKINIYLR